MSWIKIEEGQPPMEEPVYVIDINEKQPRNSMNICRLHEIRTVKTLGGINVSYEWYEGKSGCDEWYYNVTHWMPLPELP